MSYNPHFKINPDQLQVIEDALRAEIGRLSAPNASKFGKKNPKHETAKKLRDLLGHLHNQKLWYAPKESVPLG